jgi:hypothetical protein
VDPAGQLIPCCDLLGPAPSRQAPP